MTRHPMPMGDQSVHDGYNMMHPDMNSRTLMHGLSNFHMITAALVFFALVLLAFVASNDATRRGRSGIFWGFATLLVPFLSIPIYLILIMSEQSDQPQVIEPRRQRITENYPAQRRAERSFVPDVPVKLDKVESTPEKSSVTQSNAVTKTSVQFCTTCGQKNSLEAIYCNRCGNKVVT